MTPWMMLCLLLAMTGICSDLRVQASREYLQVKRIGERGGLDVEAFRVFRTLAPEIVNNWDFAVTLTRLVDSPSYVPPSVEIIGSGLNNISRRCELRKTFHAAPPFTRRLSDKRILLRVWEYPDERHTFGTDKVRLILLDVDTCEYDYAYKGNLFPGRNFIFTNNNDNSSDERFAVVTYDARYCRGSNWCRLFFNPTFQKFEPLDVDFQVVHVKSIEPVGAFDDDLLVVHLLDAHNNYNVRLYDLSKKRSSDFGYKRLLVSHTGDEMGSSPEIVSSGLAFCWMKSTFHENSIVHCSTFREDGSLVFNRTIAYPDPVEFLHLAVIPNGIVIFTKMAQCAENNLFADIVIITSNITNCESNSSLLEKNQMMRIKRIRFDAEGCGWRFIKGLKVTTMPSEDNVIEVRCLYDHLYDSISYNTFRVSTIAESICFDQSFFNISKSLVSQK